MCVCVFFCFFLPHLVKREGAVSWWLFAKLILIFFFNVARTWCQKIGQCVYSLRLHNVMNLNNKCRWREKHDSCLWRGSKGVINFPWIFFFYAMRSLVPVGHFRNISGHLFTWLVYGSFQWRHWLLFTDCIMWNDKDKVAGFKRSHWIHLGWWISRASTVSIITPFTCLQLSNDIFFSSLSIKYDIKIQNAAIWRFLR